LVVVPDAGVPAEAFLAQFDLVERSRPLFAHLQPHVYPPAIMQLSDVQLLEGIADLAKNVPTLPGQERDLLKLIAGWRWAATKQGESPLQLFLMRRGFPAPLTHSEQQPQGDSAPRRHLISTVLRSGQLHHVEDTGVHNDKPALSGRVPGARRADFVGLFHTGIGPLAGATRSESRDVQQGRRR
jgi:hypothetical protein